MTGTDAIQVHTATLKLCVFSAFSGQINQANSEDLVSMIGNDIRKQCGATIKSASSAFSADNISTLNFAVVI